MNKKQTVLARLEMNDHVPMRAKEFKKLLGIDPRDLRDIVRELRLEHVKVCSGDPGYWLWNGVDDSWKRTKARIRSQMMNECKLLAAMDGVVDGQIGMFYDSLFDYEFDTAVAEMGRGNV